MITTTGNVLGYVASIRGALSEYFIQACRMGHPYAPVPNCGAFLGPCTEVQVDSRAMYLATKDTTHLIFP